MAEKKVAEFQGLLFTREDEVVTIHDLNYGCLIGKASLVEGPGWILTLETSFLDGHQLRVLSEFINQLNQTIKK